jgi:hypothetical protein
MPLPRWVEPQLSKLVEKALTGPNWVPIKFDGYRMAARDDGEAFSPGGVSPWARGR